MRRLPPSRGVPEHGAGRVSVLFLIDLLTSSLDGQPQQPLNQPLPTSGHTSDPRQPWCMESSFTHLLMLKSSQQSLSCPSGDQRSKPH